MTTLPFDPRFGELRPSLIRQVFAAAPPGCLNMGLGQPDLPVLPPLVDAVSAEVATGYAPYSPNAGRAPLRQALADMLSQWRAEGAEVAPWASAASVIVTSGVEEGLYVALSAFCGPDTDILVPDPGFPAYAMIAACVGARVRTYACGAAEGFAPSAEAIEAALTPQTRAVVVNSPGNPTGVVADPEQLEAIAALLRRRGIPYVSDEIYDRYVYTGPFVSVSAFSDFGVVLSGLSKTANMMGWRLGWLLAPEASASTLTRIHQAVCTCASTLAQAAAQAAAQGLAAESGEVKEAMARNVAIFAQRRLRALSALDAHGFSYAPNAGAFYLFVDVRDRLRDGEDDLGLCMRLLTEQKLIAIPGQGFGEAGRGWVRLAFTCAEVEEGVRRFAAAF